MTLIRSQHEISFSGHAIRDCYNLMGAVSIYCVQMWTYVNIFSPYQIDLLSFIMTDYYQRDLAELLRDSAIRHWESNILDDGW